MARKYRIAAIGIVTTIALLAALLGGAYYAAQQVQPYYEQALRTEPEVLQRGGQELESRASVLYTDVKQVGRWKALFTDQQINGWLATQLPSHLGGRMPEGVSDPRIAITSEAITLGYRNHTGGVETVISVSASVLLTEEGDIGIRLISAHAGALPLPIMTVADRLATSCKKAKLPARWTQQDGLPVGIVSFTSKASTENRDFFVDTIELRKGEMYVAGHTEDASGQDNSSPRVARAKKRSATNKVAVDDFTLPPVPKDDQPPADFSLRPSADSKQEEATTSR